MVLGALNKNCVGGSLIGKTFFLTNVFFGGQPNKEMFSLFIGSDKPWLKLALVQRRGLDLGLKLGLGHGLGLSCSRKYICLNRFFPQGSGLPLLSERSATGEIARDHRLHANNDESFRILFPNKFCKHKSDHL